jgi:AraC family transcriptional regulator of adaptative response/methylated-DNA-[protein]-cysteine methyltransferase
LIAFKYLQQREKKMGAQLELSFKTFSPTCLQQVIWGIDQWQGHKVIILFEDESLVGFGFASSLFTPEAVATRLSNHLRPKQFIRNDAHVSQLFNRLYTSNMSIRLYGTQFQHEVWRALSSIPQTHTTSYQRIAQAIHKPLAARAVGQAIGRNPVAYFIPCHRVLAANGKLGGFLWGSDIKLALLALDQAALPR